MKKNDSKNLWLNIDNIIPFKNFSLGRYTTQALFDDPASISFISSRYKFCAKLLSNKKNLLEVGCGDGFGSIIVQQACKKLKCTDLIKYLLNTMILEKENTTKNLMALILLMY